jgi:hypothetical protein
MIDNLLDDYGVPLAICLGVNITIWGLVAILNLQS